MEREKVPMPRGAAPRRAEPPSADEPDGHRRDRCVVHHCSLPSSVAPPAQASSVYPPPPPPHAHRSALVGDAPPPPAPGPTSPSKMTETTPGGSTHVPDETNVFF